MPPVSSDLPILLHALAPVFVLVALGWGLRAGGLLGESTAEALNKLLYRVLLPAQLIATIAAADLRHAYDHRAAFAALAAFIIGLALTLGATVGMPSAWRGSLATAATRANAAYIGLPVVQLVARTLPDARGAALEATYGVLLAMMVPAFNVGSVLGFLLPQHGVSWGGVRRSLVELPRNPLILASAVGIVLGLCCPGALAPTVPGRSIAVLALAATPCALLATGAAIDLHLVRARPLPLLAACVAKLVALPALTWGIGRALDTRPEPLAAAVVLMACPAAMAGLPMARELGGDERLTAAVIVATTVAAPFTLLLWLALLT